MKNKNKQNHTIFLNYNYRDEYTENYYILKMK